MSEYSEVSVSPINWLKIFFRRKELLIIPIYIGLILGICLGMLLPKKYRSSTIIHVEEGKTDNPLFTNLAVSTTVTQRMNAIRESMLGWNSLLTLVKRLNMDKNIKSPQELEDLIFDIRRNIFIRLRGQSIIDLSYIGLNPEQTQAVVKNITDIFIERNQEAQDKETADAIIFIENQLRVYQGKIKSSEIAKLQDQLNTLLTDSTEAHPRVKQLREEIKNKKEELAKENLEYTETGDLDTKTNNPIIEEIKKALETVGSQTAPTPDANKPPENAANKDIYKVMLIDKLDNVLARDIDVNTSIYNMLLQRLETAKITQRLQSSKEGTKYTILDPPRVPLKPFKPNKFLLAIMGLVLGTVAGVALVIFREFLDKSFLDVEEAKEFLGSPLLGAISKINTMESLQQERQRKIWVSSVTAIGGIVVVIIAYVISGLMKL